MWSVLLRLFVLIFIFSAKDRYKKGKQFKTTFRVIKCLIRKSNLVLGLKCIHDFTSGYFALFDKSSILVVPENSLVCSVLRRN